MATIALTRMPDYSGIRREIQQSKLSGAPWPENMASTGPRAQVEKAEVGGRQPNHPQNHPRYYEPGRGAYRCRVAFLTLASP